MLHTTVPPVGENPISKTTLVITDEDAVVHLTEVQPGGDNTADGVSQGNNEDAEPARGNLQTLSNQQLLQTLLAQVGTLQHQITRSNRQREADRVSMRNLI